MAGKIAYRFETTTQPESIVYVNLIANYACINDCIFCSRPRTKEETGKKNIYEKKVGSSLYLKKSPSVDEILISIDKEIRTDDKEITIIGLGEPLLYLPKVVEVIRKVKQKYEIKTRVDTNGLVKNKYENAAEQLKNAGLDEIRISVNAINKDEYNLLCRPKIREAFPQIISFVKDCLEQKIETFASFVIGFDKGIVKTKTEKEYAEFALAIGIKKENIILRDFVKPLETTP